MKKNRGRDQQPQTLGFLSGAARPKRCRDEVSVCGPLSIGPFELTRSRGGRGLCQLLWFCGFFRQHRHVEIGAEGENCGMLIAAFQIEALF